MKKINLGKVKGENGKSAFEIARDLGRPNTSSEEEWLNSLKGDKGETGEIDIEILEDYSTLEYVNEKIKFLQSQITECKSALKYRVRLYHTDGKSKQIYRLNPETFAVEATRGQFGESVKGIGGGFDGKKARLFHIDGAVSNNRIYELNPDTLEPIRNVPVPEGSLVAQGIGGDFDGEKLRLFMVDSSRDIRNIYELDVETLQPIKTVNYNHITKLYGIDGVYDGEKLRVFAIAIHGGQGYILELDSDTLEEINRVPVNSNKPYGITGTFDGEKARLFYCEYQNHKIYELDIDDFSEIKSAQSPNTLAFGLGAVYDVVPNLNKTKVVRGAVDRNNSINSVEENNSQKNTAMLEKLTLSVKLLLGASNINECEKAKVKEILDELEK